MGGAVEGGAVKGGAVAGGVDMNIKLGLVRAANDTFLTSSYFCKVKRQSLH